jgi:hypothetical protein
MDEAKPFSKLEAEDIEDPDAYNKTKEELKNYIKPENQKKFRRKVVEKRELKLKATPSSPQQVDTNDQIQEDPVQNQNER